MANHAEHRDNLRAAEMNAMFALSSVAWATLAQLWGIYDHTGHDLFVIPSLVTEEPISYPGRKQKKVGRNPWPRGKKMAGAALRVHDSH